MVIESSNASQRNKISIENFTSDQKKAYKSLMDFIKAPYDEKDYKRALIGPAGTGKTYSCKALIENCGLSYSVIGVSAPTHKAKRVLSDSLNIPQLHVNTLQSDLGLRVNFDIDNFNLNNIPFDPRGKIKIEKFQLYIVDEASMIPRDLCIFLERECKKHNVKLIYMGDASQLPPVKEKYSSALRGIKTHALKQIVRQGNDNPISELLEMLRNDIDNRTYTFLEYISNVKVKYNENYTKGFEVYDLNTFTDKVLFYFNNEELTSNVDFVKLIAYTNITVSAWNKFIRCNIIDDANTNVITKNDLITSYTTLVDEFNNSIIQNSEEYIIHDLVNYKHKEYGLKGFMVRFQQVHGGNITPPLFIVDHNDLFTINQYNNYCTSLIESATNSIRAMKADKWRKYYAFKEECLLLQNISDANNNNKIKFFRDLDYGFALTSHKSQGSTFNNVLVDVNNMVYDNNGCLYKDIDGINRRLYVACSRAKDKLILNF